MIENGHAVVGNARVTGEEGWNERSLNWWTSLLSGLRGLMGTYEVHIR